MYLQKVKSRKNCVKKLVFCWLKVNDENRRIRIQDPDPLVRGMDPRFRIHTKMSWIRNTASIYSTSPTCCCSLEGGFESFWEKSLTFLFPKVCDGRLEEVEHEENSQADI
jgi:hypothetical protein